jgi:hypothetical protein
MILRVFALLNRSALLARNGRRGLSSLLLPAIAFACVAALLALVLGGAQTFWGYTDDLAGFYQGCAVIALVLLTVPLVSLGAAAARLSTRRRDDRLAALRLLGASGSATATLAVLEAAIVALEGAALGALLAFAAGPLVGLIPFRGEPLGTAGVILPAWEYAAIVAGIALIATISAALSLRRVIISPLGVALKQSPPRVPWLPALIAVAGILLAAFVMGNLGAFGGVVAIIAAVGIALTITLFAIDVIGTWLVGALARGRAKRAQTPERLLAARAILESPRTAWRQVSGVAMSSSMAVLAGSGVAMLGAIEGSGESFPEDYLVGDIRTGIIITVVGTFLMVACAVGVNQAAQILDRRDISHSLDIMGASFETQDRARREAAMRPLLLATLGPAALAALLLLPVIGGALIFAPLSLAVILATLALGVGIVVAALYVTRPLLRQAVRTA